MKFEILLHAADICIVDVLLIQVLDHLAETSKGQQEHVKPANEVLLLLRPVLKLS